MPANLPNLVTWCRILMIPLIVGVFYLPESWLQAENKNIAVAFIGKLKTVGQMIAIPLLLFHDELFGLFNCQWLGTILINVAAVLTVISMLYYLRKAGAAAGGAV